MAFAKKLLQQLSIAAVAALAPISAPISGAVAQTVELKISHFLPAVHGVQTDFIAPWAAELEKRSGGKVKTTIFPAGSSFGNVDRQLDQIKAGVVDIAFGVAAVPRDRLPRVEIADMPLLSEDRTVINRALWSIADKHLRQDFAGLKLLAIFADCTQIHTRNKVIKTLDDLKGVRLRVPSQLAARIMTAVGAIPAAIPWTQTYENLEKGVIDGSISPWDTIAAARLSEVTNAHLDNIVLCGEMWFAMNARKYEALPAEVRAAIDATSGDTLVNQGIDWIGKWSQAGRDAATASKATITKLSDTDRARWKQMVEPIVEDRLKEIEGLGAKDIRDVYKDLTTEIARLESMK